MKRLARATFVLSLAVASPWVMSGCVAVDGGALEGYWVINVAERSLRIDCACSQIDRVVFSLLPQGNRAGDVDPCADVEGGCHFGCDDGVGTTRFVVPEGPYAISVVPLGTDGGRLGPADGVVVPPPVVRDVIEGELTSLGVSLFIVARSRLAGPDRCEEDWLQPP